MINEDDTVPLVFIIAVTLFLIVIVLKMGNSLSAKTITINCENNQQFYYDGEFYKCELQQ